MENSDKKPRSNYKTSSGASRSGGFRSKFPRKPREAGEGGERPARTEGRSFSRRPREDGDKPFSDRPKRSGFGGKSFGRPSFNKDRPPRRDGEGSFSRRPREDGAPSDRPERSFSDRAPRGDRPFSDRPKRGGFGGKSFGRPSFNKDRPPRRDGERSFSRTPRDGEAPASQIREDRPHRSGTGPRHFDRPRDAGGRDGGRFGGGKFKKPYRAGGRSFDRDAPRRPREFAKESVPSHKDVRLHPDSVMLWGLHAVGAAWLNPARKVLRLLVTDAGQKSMADIFARYVLDPNQPRPEATVVERHELDSILPAGSVHQGIVMEAMPLEEKSLADIIETDTPPSIILMLDQVTDPHNVGAILRSAAAFGAGAVVLTERNAPGITGVLTKSASGAVEHVPMLHVTNLARAIDDLHKAGYWCVGLAEEGEKTLSESDLTGRVAILLGAEGEGLRHLTRQKCDELARLPTGGEIGSLNVSNAAAVALYEITRQKKK